MLLDCRRFVIETKTGKRVNPVQNIQKTVESSMLHPRLSKIRLVRLVLCMLH